MNKNELSIRNIFFSIWHRLPIILLITAIVAAGTWSVSTFFIKPTYTTYSKMIAISNKDRESDYYTTSEHNAAIALVLTISEVVKTDEIMKDVSENLLAEYGLNYTTKQLQRMTSVMTENDTEVFRIQVTGANKDHLPRIANTVASVTQEKINEITRAGEAQTLQWADNPTLKSPNTPRNTVLGALIGFILAAAFFVIRDLYDTTIWTEEDLTSRFDIPVLGMVPQINIGDSSGK